MSFPKVLVSISILLFAVIALISFMKKSNGSVSTYAMHLTSEPIEIDLSSDDESTPEPEPESNHVLVSDIEEKAFVEPKEEEQVLVSEEDLPTADRIDELFNKREPRLPIVQTITYKSHVPWLKGRPAWVSDYASHYKTSRHFIARSLNGKLDYEKQNVAEGDRFNVLREDKDFDFYLLVDLSTSKMWLYYIDNDTNERVLLKNYRVGVGRPDSSAASGYLTPTGKYSLGDKVAVYRPKTMGFHQGEKTEMVRIFGTRWIPFGEEISGCTEPAKGYGIHGLPLKPNTNGELVEDMESLGRYESDGCIRMATKDVEELFAIILTRPTTVELVKGFHSAKLPGKPSSGN